MRKLIMWNLMTLDGLFEGAQPWDLDFHLYAWGDDLKRFAEEQGKEIGGMVFGRRTYEGMAAHWVTQTGEVADYMNALPKYVFSRTLERADWNNSTVVKGDAGAGIQRLKQESGKDLFLFGSADLSETFIRHGAFDEYRIGLVPVTLGAGTPLFKPGAEPLKLQLEESRPLGARCQLLRYTPAAAEATAG